MKKEINNVEIIGKLEPTISQRVRKFNADAGTKLDRGMMSFAESKNEVNMILEEVQELRDAMMANDKKEICDALADIVYVAYGTAAKLGIDLDKALERVCISNDTKYIDGKLVKNEDGKIIKGDNYQPPNLEGCY